MIDFLTEDSLIDVFRGETVSAVCKKTKRHGVTLNLRSIVYDCIRASAFQLFDYPTKILNPQTLFPYLTLAGEAGNALHEKFQKSMGLDKMPHTEKLYTFKYFSPLNITSKCDGIDVNRHILYEIKTKSKSYKAPDMDEVRQAFLSAFLFNNELNVPVGGVTMIYINRANCKFSFFNFDFTDQSSPYFHNAMETLRPTFERIQIIRNCIETKELPPMNSPHVITRNEYGDCCVQCPYQEVCQSNGETKRQ